VGFGAIAESVPCSTNRCRTRQTVDSPTSSASAISASDQPGPPSASSALSRMRAWVSFLAAALPDEIIASSSDRSSGVSVT
jgi:hypothetical protein